MKISKDAILIKMAEQCMSRQALAEKSGITYKVISDIMRKGHAAPQTCGKIAHALGCNVVDILE